MCTPTSERGVAVKTARRLWVKHWRRCGHAGGSRCTPFPSGSTARTLTASSSALVPQANWGAGGRAREKPFPRVAYRLAAFFGDARRELDVVSAHIFGYGQLDGPVTDVDPKI